MGKEEIRQSAWRSLVGHGVARFPLPHQGRIPNSIGPEAAAGAISRTEVWRGARVLKRNPDAPQKPLRATALREGKLVYMAGPRLRDPRCFIELDSMKVGKPSRASPIGPRAAIFSRLGETCLRRYVP